MLVAVVATGIGWFERPARLTATEAVQAAEAAFRAAGLGDVVIDPEVVAGTYTADGADVPVWKTLAPLGGGAVELWLARDDGQPVFLDDRTPNGTERLLSDAQFEALDVRPEHPARDRLIRRNVVLTLAALLVVVLASQLGTTKLLRT